jgi:hypothetical protein
MKIGITSNFADVAKQINEIGKQAKFAAAVALTKTAQDMRSALQVEMTRAFDRPVPYTINSLFVKGANKNNLEALVWVKDNAFSNGTPADRYLGPQIFGGERLQKKMERMLQRVGALPAGWHTVPGEGAEIDSYGNMSRGQIIKVLSWLQAFGEQGYKKNATKATKDKIKRGSKSKLGMEYFVSKGRGSAMRGGKVQHLPAGVWSKTSFGSGKAIKPILIFVKATRYQPRFKFFEVGTQVAEKNFPGRFDEELERALRTARPA